jgi:delta(3,5)-delta(2,4)-dienoyl-CoA isomerase
MPKICKSVSWVREVCLTARNFSAVEAYEQGLVSKVYPDQNTLIDESLNLASLIASKAPIATYGTKKILNYSRDHTVDEGLEYVAVWNASMLNSPDTIIAVTSILSKTAAIFPRL